MATLVFALLMLLGACAKREAQTTSEMHYHPDATYRGAFIDEGIIQVNLQFTLVDGIVTEASFRHLVGAKPEYNFDTEQEPYRSVVAQYEEVLDIETLDREAKRLGVPRQSVIKVWIADRLEHAHA